MQCRTLASQRPCGWTDCEREECTIARVRMNQTLENETMEAIVENHQAMIRLYRLIGNQPGYATFTVKQILGAINNE